MKTFSQWVALIVFTLIWGAAVYAAAIFLIFHIEQVWLKLILIAALVIFAMALHSVVMATVLRRRPKNR